MTAKSSKAVISRARSSVTYPYHPLSTCLEVAKAIREIGNGKQEVSRTLLASHMKADENSGDFAKKIASAKCYGLIEGRSDFKLSAISIGLYFPTEDPEREKRIALLEAARSPGAFAALLDRFDGSKPPPIELISNVLSQYYGIPESWKIRIATFFIKAMETAGAISEDGFLRHKAEMEKVISIKGIPKKDDGGMTEEKEKEEAERKLREKAIKDKADLEEPDQESVIVWKYPFKGKMLRIETPVDITPELWNKLNRYIEVLNPDIK